MIVGYLFRGLYKTRGEARVPKKRLEARVAVPQFPLTAFEIRKRSESSPHPSEYFHAVGGGWITLFAPATTAGLVVLSEDVIACLEFRLLSHVPSPPQKQRRVSKALKKRRRRRRRRVLSRAGLRSFTQTRHDNYSPFLLHSLFFSGNIRCFTSTLYPRNKVVFLLLFFSTRMLDKY